MSLATTLSLSNDSFTWHSAAYWPW